MKIPVALCVLLSIAAPALAQAPAGATIVLPQQLVAAQPATLAVLGPDGRLLPDAKLDFSGGKQVVTDATGRASFRAPNDPGVLVVRLSGTSTSATATVLAASATPEGVQVTQVPRVAMLGEPFLIRGSGFSGEADGNRVAIGDRPAAVLAASQVALVVLPSAETGPGATRLVIEVGGRSSDPVPVRLVVIELVAGRSSLAAGEKGKVEVRIRGSEQPLELEVRNLTPQIVRLIEGDVQRVRTGGGGQNSATLEMEGLRPGDFSINARVVPSVAGLPDTEAARDQLLAARAQAPPAWAPRVDRLITQLEESPQNALRVRNEVEKMLAELPPGEFGRSLEAAWRALLGRK